MLIMAAGFLAVAVIVGNHAVRKSRDDVHAKAFKQFERETDYVERLTKNPCWPEMLEVVGPPKELPDAPPRLVIGGAILRMYPGDSITLGRDDDGNPTFSFRGIAEQGFGKKFSPTNPTCVEQRDEQMRKLKE